MAKLVFLSFPGHGHVNPTIAVAKELVDRGEKVVYYLPESYRGVVEATGASFHGYESGLEGFNPPVLDSSSAPTWVFPLMIIDESRRALNQVLDSIRAEKPDFIFYDGMCVWARIVAEKLGVPAISYRPTYAMNERTNIFALRDASMAKAMGELMERMRSDLHQLCAEYGVSAMEPREIFTHAEPLNIVFIPRAFQPDEESFDDRFVFVGPSLLPRHDSSAFPFGRLGGQPLLYISLGTVFNDRPDFFNACFAAFGDLPMQVVMSRGRRVDPATLGPTPHNFTVSPHVPQLEVLARARAFVTHGGMNSTMESIYYGVPMVVIPQMPEQAMTARRVEELGLGLALKPEELSPRLLRDAVTRVMSEASFGEKVREMQRLAREAGGYRRAADAILEFERTWFSRQARAA